MTTLKPSHLVWYCMLLRSLSYKLEHLSWQSFIFILWKYLPKSFLALVVQVRVDWSRVSLVWHNSSLSSVNSDSGSSGWNKIEDLKLKFKFDSNHAIKFNSSCSTECSIEEILTLTCHSISNILYGIVDIIWAILYGPYYTLESRTKTAHQSRMVVLPRSEWSFLYVGVIYYTGGKKFLYSKRGG